MRNWVIGLAAIAAAGGASAQMAGRSIWQGVYTAEQADRGDTVYAARCAACHGVSLERHRRGPRAGRRRVRQPLGHADGR